MTHMGHSSSRAALIHPHLTSGRDRAIPDRLGVVIRAARGRRDSNLRHPLQEFDLVPAWSRFMASTGAARDCRLLPLAMVVDVNVGCHLYGPGIEQTSNGSSGRSAQPHQACRPAHFHNHRQIRRPSSSRSERTKPPDFMGRPHSD
ncbi:hypothetical protein AB0478_17505 [Streptomyces sp. NPDC051917]|uniref:hypothetical protein n=1 Tax=Streptomyces sp. NPDC051917 TaxID=3154754 RepID=UPI00344F4772